MLYEMQDQLRQAINEFDVNNGYTTQAIKKTAFELESKHGTAQLDSKKAHQALKNIHKRCEQLQDSLQFGGNSSGTLHASIDKSPGLRPSRGSSLSRSNNQHSSGVPPSPSANTVSHQQKLVADIQSQVAVLTQSFFTMSDKLNTCDEDLKFLINQVPKEQASHFNKLKSIVERTITDALKLTNPDAI